MYMLRTILVLSAMALACGSHLRAESPSPGAIPTQDAFFNLKKIWNVHLVFTEKEWDAVEPRQGSRPPRRENRGFLVGPEGGRNGIAAALGFEFPEVPATFVIGSSIFDKVAIRYKGNGTFLSSRDSLKRSFKIDLNDIVKGQKLVGLSQINLHNSVRDPSHMNEPIGYKLFRDAGIPAPRTAFAKVYVSVPNKYERHYFGLYNIVEDVGGAFVKANFKEKGGALLKPVTQSLFSDIGDDWSDYNQVYDPKGDLSDHQKMRIIETCKFFSHASESDFVNRAGDFIDLDNFARYLAMTVWLSDMDGILGPGQNYYVYLNPDSNKFMFIPWDQDQSFGQYPRGSQEQREQLSIHKPWNEGNAFFEKMFKVDGFKTRYLAALKDINENVIKVDEIGKLVDELAVILRDPVGEESPDRQKELDKAAAGQTITTLMTGGRSWFVETKPIKMFVPSRQSSIAEQLAGRSKGQTTDRGNRRTR